MAQNDGSSLRNRSYQAKTRGTENLKLDEDVLPGDRTTATNPGTVGHFLDAVTVRYGRGVGMVTVAEQHQHQHEQERYEDHGKSDFQNKEDHRHVTISDIDDDSTSYNADYNAASSADDKGYDGSNSALCLQSDSRVGTVDENGSRASSTQFSDVDSMEEDERWNSDISAPSIPGHQQFENGVALPNSEVPSFGDVCVNNSANVHFGNKTFYNGPVTIKQFVYTNPALSGENGAAHSVSDGEYLSDRTDSVHATKCRKSDVTDKPDLRNENGNFKAENGCGWLLTWRCVALFCTLGSCVVTAVVLSVVYLAGVSELPITRIPSDDSDSSLNPSGILLDNVRLISRREWIAQPPKEPLAKLHLPVPYVIISHTATDFCKTQAECTFLVRFAQTFHIESRNWTDIAYNFLIGGDGYAYEGRNWDHVGAHTFGYNTKSIGISFIGTFNSVTPPDYQLNAAKELIKSGVKCGKIASNYTLLGHRQLSRTLSPGDKLYEIIKTWEHWRPHP